MSTDQTVYRSSHPATLATWHDTHKLADEIGERRRALLDALGFEGRTALVNDRRLVGVEHREQHGPIPEGWRHDPSVSGAIVPDRRRKVGKDVGKKFDELTLPDLRRSLPGGMPEMAIGDGKAHWPSIALIADAIYVKWRCDPEKVERGNRIDPEMWQRIKLSEYYAVVEAAQADGEAGR